MRQHHRRVSVILALGRKSKLNRKSRESVAGDVPLAQFDPRDRVVDASVSSGKNASHASASTTRTRALKIDVRKGAWQQVVMEWGWNGARRTSPTTQTRAPRVHVVFQSWPFTRSRPPRERVTLKFGNNEFRTESCASARA